MFWFFEFGGPKCPHKKFCVAHLPRRYIPCYTEDDVAPPLPGGLNLMLFGLPNDAKLSF